MGSSLCVLKRKLLREYQQCGKGAEQVICHSHWLHSLIPVLTQHRYPTIASNTHTCKQMNTLGITTPAHAIMYIHIGVEADMETKSRNRVPAVGSHKYSQAPTLFFPSVPTSISVGWEMIWSGSVFWSLVWTHGVQQQWKMRLLSHGHLFF